MNELVMVEQRRGSDDASHWIREGGQTVPGQDSNLRLDELRAGLARHERVRAVEADATDEALERICAAMHERGYLDALRGVNGNPVLMPEFAPPGLEPDIPVDAALVAAAHEAVRTAISAATRLAAGARYTYAVCRPPGHHAGPDFLGGYCYLNNAAAAVRTLDEAGIGPVAILDLDLHYPNGTAALVERMGSAQSALAARRAGHQRLRRHGPAASRERDASSPSARRPTPRPTWARSAPRSTSSPPGPPPSSSRSATTPSPATRTGAGTSSRRSSPRSGTCWPPPSCRSA